MTYPNFPGKYAHAALFTPSEFISYLRRVGRLNYFETPDALVLCYHRSLYEHVLATEGVSGPDEGARRSDRYSGYRGLVTLPSTNHRVGVLGNFGFGAPGATGAMETFIALGTKRFISIGTAGTLQPQCPIASIVLCDRAVRDEGISHHYLPPGKYVEASPRLTESLRRECDARNMQYAVGTSWTIDALFRETAQEADHYRKDGVLCVEMEAAALFAVSLYRSVEVASVFVISDSLMGGVWEPQWHSTAVSAGLIAVYDAAVNALVLDPMQGP